MDYEALKTEVAKPEYAAMSDAEVAAALAAQTVAVRQNVQIADVEAYLRLKGLVYGLSTWLASNPAPSIGKASTFELVNMIESPRLAVFETSVQAKYDALAGMLDAIIAAGAGLQEADKTALLALADTTAPKWPDITTRDVWIARGQP